MNPLGLFLTGADKGIANAPLFSSAPCLVLILAFSGQSDHFFFRVSNLASSNQPTVGVRPNEKRIGFHPGERFGDRHPGDSTAEEHSRNVELPLDRDLLEEV